MELLSFLLCLAWLAAVLAALYVIGTWNFDYFEKHNLPFVKPLPFVGNLGPLVTRKAAFPDILNGFYKSFKGHRAGGYFEFLSPVMMILDPDLIRQIIVKDFDHFTDHRLPIREDADPLFGKNMFTLQGERWRDMRHTLSPAFTSSKMKTMFVLVRQTGAQLAAHVDDNCKASKDNLWILDMKDLLTRYANDVIATAAFGLQCDSLQDQDNEFYSVSKDTTDFDGKVGLRVFGFLFSTRLMKLLKVTLVTKYNANFFRSLVHGTMAMRERENIVRPDMIQLLMQAKKGKLKHDVTDDPSETVSSIKDAKKTELSDDDLTAQALLFLLAGFDTASTLMCFMSHLLAVHPDVQRRVQQEVDEVLQESDGVLTYEGMKRMTYMDMVIMEVLRLFPPAVNLERLCTKTLTFEATESSPALTISKGQGILLPMFAIHRDPEYFPDPMKFDPERFSEENKPNINPFTYLPFGGGPRICIGLRFAMMETKIAFTSLLSRFNLEVVSKTSVPIGLSKITINMNADGGFWLGIRPRASSAT